MSAGKYPRGLPPQYPQTYRRGSNTPVINKADDETQLTPNRSRSLDGLLDSDPCEKIKIEPSPDASQKTQSCEDILKQKIDFRNSEKPTEEKNALCIDSLRETKKESILEESFNSEDKKSSSTLSLQSNSSDTKRKRNFMDRCVNKVRSLIKK